MTRGKEQNLSTPILAMPSLKVPKCSGIRNKDEITLKPIQDRLVDCMYLLMKKMLFDYAGITLKCMF